MGVVILSGETLSTLDVLSVIFNIDLNILLVTFFRCCRFTTFELRVCVHNKGHPESRSHKFPSFGFVQHPTVNETFFVPRCRMKESQQCKRFVAEEECDEVKFNLSALVAKLEEFDASQVAYNATLTDPE